MGWRYHYGLKISWISESYQALQVSFFRTCPICNEGLAQKQIWVAEYQKGNCGHTIGSCSWRSGHWSCHSVHLESCSSQVVKKNQRKLKSFSDFFLLDWVQENHASFTTACNHDGSSWFIRILVKMMTSPLATALVYSKEIADNAVFRVLPTIQSDLLPFLWRSLPLQKGAMCSICLGALTRFQRGGQLMFNSRSANYHIIDQNSELSELCEYFVYI